MEASSTIAIYIHWPFCKKKCPYCDFNSHVREQVDHAAWREALVAELRYWKARHPASAVSSIFFGGGTPSLMQPQTVEALIDDIQKHYAVKDCEITLEANPTSVEAGKFRDLATAGVNRVSLGVQSLRDDSLKFLGREHSAREALSAVELAANIFPRYSFDLIYALPDHTPDIWEKELKEALGLARGHLSLYQLTIEENTAFHHAYHTQHAFDLPAEPVAAELYLRTQTLMEDAGLPSYEISNHATPGEESRHNLTYWRGQDYFGIGPGAHGRVGGHATRNLKSPERWLESVTQRSHGLEEETILTASERMEEKTLMGLRLTREGFDPAALAPDEREHFNTRTSDGRIDQLIAHGLVQNNGTRLIPTPNGQLVLNSLITELLKD